MDEDEDQRVVELFRYRAYHADLSPPRLASNCEERKKQPSDSSLENAHHPTQSLSSQIRQPDTTLLALCQFAAIKLDAQVVGISLLGRHDQFILAESTQSLELDGANAGIQSEDKAWLGIAQVRATDSLEQSVNMADDWEKGDWHYNLCKRTIHAQVEDDALLPLCGVPDVTVDAVLSTLPFVKGPPHLKSFWGAPIRTMKRYKIGVLWMLDDKSRPELSKDQIRFIGTISSLVMQNLESRKESIERRKILRMTKAIDQFIDGDQGDHDPRNGNSSAAEASGLQGYSRHQDVSVQTQSNPPPPSPVRAASENTSHRKTARAETTIVSKAGAPTNDEAIDSIDKRDRDLVYARASYLIREGLTMQGCVFYDTSSGFLARDRDSEVPTSSRKRGNVVRTGSYNVLGDPANQRAQERRKRQGVRNLLAAPGSKVTSSTVPIADVLGFAFDDSSSLYGSRPEAIDAFPFLEEDFLFQLTRKYANGTTWLFREDGTLSTSTDQEALDRRSLSDSATSKNQYDYEHRKAEAAILQNALDEAKQIIFVPLFEAELSHATAGCFAFTTDVTRISSAGAELGFVKSFVNSVGAQVARINAIAADKSKNAFIGSISHELRSPLHGILAAAEFLEETNVDTYQKSLINTQVSCGKTLLQVIEHVLDYSKINSFEKDEQAASKQGAPLSSDRLDFGTKMQNLYVNTDIAELCEEVVEGSVAGKSHMQSDIGVTSSTAEAYARRDQGEGLSKQKAHEDLAFGFNKNVAVILDFDYQKDWTYVTQPGALRRILMNVLGNSLKYTASGCIRVRLGVQSFDDPTGELSSIMFLSVSDTGRGISHEFLRKKLFNPFSQEDHLSSGCGLGLSIVKSLVDTLKGNLEVQSEQGIGTTVSVEIPLSRGGQNHSTEDSSPLIKPAEAENLRLPEEGLTVGFIGFQSDGKDRLAAFEGRDGSIKENILNSVANCMVDWLQMEPFPEPGKQIHEADYVVILVDERIADFIQPYVHDVQQQQPRVIALLASEMSRRDVEHILGQSIYAFEVMSAPFGPRKMARAVAACEKAAANWKGHFRRLPPLGTLEKLKAVQTDLDVGSYLLQRNGLVIRPKINIVRPPHAQPTNGLRITDKPPQEEQHSEPKGSTRPTTPPKSAPSQHRTRNARLLLVDDNAINLRLLETFMGKRRCDYSCAENGLLAVEAFEAAQEEQDARYGIIFMDISMPVMDGLEATREIRNLEQKEREKYEKGSRETPRPTPALIVALTGLANSQDQANAFASGVDLFMTKPVKFKEIGRLLDDWSSGKHVTAGVDKTHQ